jgi:hypothetical protein
MKPMTPVLLAAACLLGRPAFAETGTETLRQVLTREHLDLRAVKAEELDEPVSSGDNLATADTQAIETSKSSRQSDCLYVLHRPKGKKRWRAAEVCWPPESSETACQGGSILAIDAVKGFLYLDGHINPSASCTMVLTDKLTLHDTFYGWVVGSFKDGRVVYQHSEPHFMPTHYVELSVYDPVRRRSRRIYPPDPATPLLRQYIEKTRTVYKRCCVTDPPADCGGSFTESNRNCRPELFENSIGKVMVNDAKDSITFKVRFDDAVGPWEVIYSISHLRRGKPRVRERPAGGRTASEAPPP